MRALRLSIGIILAINASTAAAQDLTAPIAAPPQPYVQEFPVQQIAPAAVPQPQPPQPVPQQPAPSPELQLLWRKLAQRDALQQEIDALCAATNSPQQLIVRTKIAEVNLTKMRKLGTDMPAYFKSMPEFHVISANNNPSDVLAFLDTMINNNIARVVSEPTLAVVSGRPSKFHVGGELAVPGVKGAPIEFKSFGTQFDVLATSLGNNRVRVQVRPRIAEVDNSQKIEVDGQEVPSLRVRELDTGTEMAIGDALVLTGMTQERVEMVRRALGRVEEKQEIALMVVVTVEDVKSMDAPPVPAIQPASANVPYTPPQSTGRSVQTPEGR